MSNYTQESLLKDLSDPTVFQSNRLSTRAYYLPQGTTLCLNGKWDFNYVQTPLAAPLPNTKDFEFQSNLNVPGHWQLQGFGKPHYTNIDYPFPVDPPNPPSENPTGTYRRKFMVPMEWASNSHVYRLRFEGVDNSFHLFLNGELVGYNEGSRNCSEFDITENIKFGDVNELWVRVYQWSSSSYIEDQDQWWLSGIFRDVHLLGFNKQGFIEDFSVVTDMDRSYSNSDLIIRLDINSEAENAEINVLLYDDEKKIINQTFTMQSSTFMETFKIDAPKKWTAESPYLYKLKLDIIVNGAVTSSVEQDVGFRKIEMINGTLQVNGTPILIRGVNRHDHHPKFGRAVPLEFIKRDMYLMKKYNINAIRTSHAPNHPKLYELANRLGFWVLDEADLECHGFYNAVRQPIGGNDDAEYDEEKLELFKKASSFTSDNKDWENAYVDRATQLVKRDRNQPCVFMWSLGNESMLGENHNSMVQNIRLLDPSRPIHYEGDLDAKYVDVYSRMYLLFETLNKFIHKTDKPLILCEYGHAMGNGPGLLRQYQDYFYKYEHFQGGFIWEWSNHGLLTEIDGHKAYAYGGDFGEYPHDGVFIMDGLVDSEHNPTPGLIEYGKVIEPISIGINEKEIVITNRFDFVDLNLFDCHFQVVNYSGFEKQIVQEGKIRLPSINPKETYKLDMKDLNLLGSVPCGKKLLEVQFKTTKTTEALPCGHVVSWCQYEIGGDNLTDLVPSLYSNKDAFRFIEDATQVEIRSYGFYVCFDKIKGKLASWISDTNQLINDGKNNLTFWRPSINNDAPIDEPYWRDFGLEHMHQNIRNVEIVKFPDDRKIAEIIVESFVSPPVLSWGFKCTQKYSIFLDEIKIKTTLIPQGFEDISIPKTIPRLGYEFCIDEDLGKSVKWFGRGPGESYSDKKESQKKGIHRLPIQELDYSYDYPQENGNHEDTEWLLLETHDNNGLCVTMKNRTFGFKASNEYGVQEAKHPFEIKRGSRYMRVDYKQHGVGTGACGPGVDEEFEFKIFKNVEIDFDISLKSVK